MGMTDRTELVQAVPGGAAGAPMVSLAAAQAAGAGAIDRLPRSLKVLAEDALFRLPFDAARAQVEALCTRDPDHPVTFMPGRALLQDFMGIPLMTDMATMRDVLATRGGDPGRLNPVIPVDFVVDHSLSAMVSGRADALPVNRRMEMERNRERFEFIKWSQGSFRNFRVIPPGRGIMHQVNLEWLSHVVCVEGDPPVARPDTMIGTDSHTTMVNALGVLGWGVGGIEAEMAMLGMPLELIAPRVVGVELTGALPEGATATDLVLHMTSFLRDIGVVGAFVEFFGPGVSRLPLADRATIANMAPEYGATCTFFPIDPLTIDYLRMTGRDDAHLARIEAYARAQGLWLDPAAPEDDLDFDARHRFDLSRVRPAMAGPARPEDSMTLGDVPASFRKRLSDITDSPAARPAPVGSFGHGAVVIAAITSCTNTSNPEVMMTAGLLARNANRKGLRPKPWAKTSLSPGSRVVTDYLTAAGLTAHLDALGFQNIGYGCATCNGSSGPLLDEAAARIEAEGLCTVAVLSGNRNFEGRIHPQIKGAYLASPPLVVAAAIAGTIDIDLGSDPLGTDTQGNPVTLADLWPDRTEVAEAVARYVTADRFTASYGAGMETTPEWEAMNAPQGLHFAWDDSSSFIRPSPFPELGPAVAFTGTISGARPLVVLGDSVTTDHISPNGAIGKDSPSGRYMIETGVEPGKLGNFGTRRGNPEICKRGMFDNPLLRNELVGGARGNATIHQPSGERVSIFEAGRRYSEEGTPALIVAGRNYGAGSSRDWAAKGLRLLGVVAVLAESFERIHRANLIGMGVLPLTFAPGTGRGNLALEGDETLDVHLGAGPPAPRMPVSLHVAAPGRASREVAAELAAVSQNEIAQLEAGGILPSLLARFGAAA